MAQILIAAVATLLLIGISVRADAMFRDKERLPRQWAWSGEVIGTAPRRIALAFLPAIAMATIWGAVILSLTVQPRAGQEGFVLPNLAVLAFGFVAAHYFYVRLVKRHFQRRGH